MALTPDQYEEMFGPGIRSEDDLDAMVQMNHSSRDPVIDLTILIRSILSDAQEELARGRTECTRQYMNRAKWVSSRLRRIHVQMMEVGNEA